MFPFFFFILTDKKTFFPQQQQQLFFSFKIKFLDAVQLFIPYTFCYIHMYIALFSSIYIEILWVVLQGYPLMRGKAGNKRYIKCASTNAPVQPNQLYTLIFQSPYSFALLMHFQLVLFFLVSV